MRWVLFVAGSAIIMALAWACGGQAVIDGESGQGGQGQGGQGQAGTSMNTTTSMSTTVTSGPGNCTPTSLSPECATCAHRMCVSQLDACCDTTGCLDLLDCVADNCNGDSEDIACIVTACIDELNAAGGATGPGTTAAVDLGECLTGCNACN